MKMRKLLLIVMLVGVVAGVASLLSGRSADAQVPNPYRVYGYAYHGANALAYHPIQAHDTNSHPNWVTVATADANGYYQWVPTCGWDSPGTIYMRAKNTCSGEDPPAGPAYPSDTPSWNHNCQSESSVRVDVHAGYCPD